MNRKMTEEELRAGDTGEVLSVAETRDGRYLKVVDTFPYRSEYISKMSSPKYREGLTWSLKG